MDNSKRHGAEGVTARSPNSGAVVRGPCQLAGCGRSRSLVLLAWGRSGKRRGIAWRTAGTG